MAYQGNDRRAPPPPPEIGWHLDKRVPLSLIAAMIAQVVVVTMFFADIKRDVELLKAKTAAIETQSNADKNTLRDSLQILRDQFSRMDAKLDRLVERGQK